MKMSADFSDVEDAAARWERRGRSIKTDAGKALQTAMPESLAAARKGTPVRTGNLKGGWSAVKTRTGFTLRNGNRYAGYVLGGNLAQQVKAAVKPKLKATSPGLVKRIERGS